jgi:Xaa-Pro aminopeptidase
VLLQPGMVLTIEPALYLSDEGIGIRIEDDVLVTSSAREVLTGTLPAGVDQIEAMLQ